MATAVESVAGPAADERERFWRRILRVAALAVVLGLVLEIVLLVLASGLDLFPGWIAAGAETVQRVAWSSLVCVALACGSTAAAQRPLVLGVLGFVSAPLAFLLARAAHKAALSALGGATATSAMPLGLAFARGIEYALFGLWIASLSRRGRTDFRSYVTVGLAVGLAFAVGLLLVQRPPVAQIPLRLVNEVVFPAGCACVLYVSGSVARFGRSAR